MIHNERIKLLANLLNTMAGSSYAIGVAAPAAASFFYTGSAVGLNATTVVAAAFAWLLIAIMLHILAQLILRNMRP